MKKILLISLLLFSNSIYSYNLHKQSNSNGGYIKINGGYLYVNTCQEYIEEEFNFSWKNNVNPIANGVKKLVLENQSFIPERSTDGIYFNPYRLCRFTNGRYIYITYPPGWGGNKGAKCKAGLTGSGFTNNGNATKVCLDGRSKSSTGESLAGCEADVINIIKYKLPVEGNQFGMDYKTNGKECTQKPDEPAKPDPKPNPPEPPPPPKPPKVGCDDAVMCERPDGGCGEGYVTGSFNGKEMCIKQPSNPNNSGNTGTNGGDTNNSSGGAPNSGGSDPNASLNNPYLPANPVTSQNNSSSSSTSGGSTLSNGGSNTGSFGNNTTGSISGKPNGNPNSSNSTGAINGNGNVDNDKNGNDKGDDDIDTSDLLDKLNKFGTYSADSRIMSAEKEVTSITQRITSTLTFSNKSCINDFTLNVPKFGSITIPISKYCDLMSIIKVFLHICCYFVCLRFILMGIKEL